MEKNGRWIKPRKTIQHYPRTEQQEKIGKAGEAIGKECKGLKGSEFKVCRSKVLQELFGAPS